MALADVGCTISTSGNCEYASMITINAHQYNNPCEQCAKILVAMETSEEGLDDFLNFWLDKQCTYLHNFCFTQSSILGN